MRMRSGVTLVLFTAASLVLLAQSPRSSEAQQPIMLDRLAITQGVFANLLAYRTIAAAEAGGFRGTWTFGTPGQQPLCVPQMGFHYARGMTTVEGRAFPVLPLLLFNKRGQLIGFELESLTPQPTPPWERTQGHPGMEFEHWTFHVYIADPTDACR